MEDNKPKREWDPVPYFMHEEILTRQEMNTRRFFIAWLITFIALIVTNAGWLYYESQFEEEVITQEITQDSGEGGSNSYSGKIVGGDDYGEADYQDYGQETGEEGEQE